MRAKKKRVLGIGGVDCRLLERGVLPPKREKNLADLVHEARGRRRRKTAGARKPRIGGRRIDRSAYISRGYEV